jgi:hypothetical protein
MPSKMFGAAWSQIGAASCRPVCRGGYSFLHSALIHCYLAWSHPINLPLIVHVGCRSLEIYFVVLAVGALHHVIVVDSWDVFLATSEAFCGKDLLLGADDVDTLFRFVHLVF